MRILDPESLSQHARVLSRPRVLHGDDELYYLMRVLRNSFLTSRRTASRRPVTVATLEDVVTADPKPMARPDQALEVREVYETIAQLPQDFRETLVAIDVLGLSYREAARALGVREATITTRLFRARKQIAARLTVEPAAGKAANEGADARDRDSGRASVAAARGEQKRPSGVLHSREAP